MNEPSRHFDPDEAPAGMQHLLNAVVAPRPIAWVSTYAADGTPNVAPHSYTTIFNVDPPIVGFVSSGRKDTLNNVESSGAFICNFAGHDLAEAMNLTSADFPPDVSEFSWAGLTPVPGDAVHAPRVGEAPVAFECRVADIHPIPGTHSVLVLGEVVRVHTAERLWQGDRLDVAALDPVGRTTGSGYARLGEQFQMKRPTWGALQAAGAEPATRIEPTGVPRR
jgi:flavin reductase (DIM6/NTAB) family NADH-FMN oxidoreductase RutF